MCWPACPRPIWRRSNIIGRSGRGQTSCRPTGDWRVWVMLAGRGAGKTRSAAEFIRSMVEAGRYRSIAIVGPTAAAIRRDMVEGQSGLLNIGPPWSRPEYQPSSLRIVWPNGAIAYLLVAEEPDRIRGLNADLAWADELASWSNQQTTLGHADAGVAPVRSEGRCGADRCQHHTKAVAASKRAPRRANHARHTRPNNGQRAEPRCVYTIVSTGPLWRHTVGSAGTGRRTDRRYRGRVVDASLLDECRIRRGTEPERMRRVVVAIDPPGASGKSSAECGIIVAGIGPDRHGYVLADLSGRYSPEQWASKAIGAYHGYKADRIVAEKNFGGEMVECTLRSIDRNVPLKMVTASRGKQIRAEPIAAFYEQHKVHHIGEFSDLEDQMCSWDPAASGPSPDRVDALVWAATELMSGPAPMRISQAALVKSRQLVARHAF